MPADLFSCCFHLLVGLFLCFTQTMCISNEWKSDFCNARCLFYQIFLFQKSSWNTAKMAKILQCLKTPQMCYLRYSENNTKNHTSLCGLNQNKLFYEWPFICLVSRCYFYHQNGKFRICEVRRRCAEGAAIIGWTELHVKWNSHLAFVSHA